MNDKIEISRNLIERTLPCIYKSEKTGAQVAKELRQALDRRDMAAEAHAMKREGQGTGAGDVLRAMTREDWDLVVVKGTCAQQATLIEGYKKIIGRYQHLCGELYQVLGALDAPAYVLDRVSNASESMVITNTPSLLPFDKHAWTSPELAELQTTIAKLMTENERLKGGQGEPFETWAERELGLPMRRIASGDYQSFGMSCAEKAWNASQPAPVSSELVQLLERAKVYARGPFLDEINACLDKVKELNQ